MNIHNNFRTIYFARVCFFFLPHCDNHSGSRLQSGQSLIEHSYRADSDLSPAGWEYAYRLKDFVLERRAKCLEQRGVDPNGRRLVVCIRALTVLVTLT
jgi:6-phosphofructo-2-kinase / fructose-2,6-biphosphatase 4